MAKNTQEKSGPKPDAKAPEDPKSVEPKAAPDSDKASDGKAAGARIAVTVRTKTGSPYRRLGRVWVRDWTAAEVSSEEFITLKADPWLEVRE